MTCRADILAMIDVLIRDRPDRTFSAPEVATAMRAAGSPYRELTIRSTITHGMCASQPDPGGRRTQDLIRVSRGRYRLT